MNNPKASFMAKFTTATILAQYARIGCQPVYSGDMLVSPSLVEALTGAPLVASTGPRAPIRYADGDDIDDVDDPPADEQMGDFD